MEFCEQFDESSPHLRKHSLNGVKAQSVGVHQCVQKIYVPEMLDEE